MNTFDAAICLIAIVAIVVGFRAGVIRSAATILGYISAAPIAVFLTAFITKGLAGSFDISTDLKSFIFICVFIAIGYVLGALLRFSIDEAVGPARSLLDQLLGAVLGAVRIGLVAVTLVLVFDRVIPAGREPGYLVGSKLQPILLKAGKQGLRSLPPETAAYIDQLKRS
ncbi:MAG: CvpA family protein [Pseudomonadota bacterium]